MHEELASQLGEWRNFEECLFHEIRWTNWLYSADLVFNYVWDRSGRIRSDVLEEPVLVALHVVGIESLRFVGALTEGMKRESERINWGLSEVAWVKATEQDTMVAISVDWGGQRRLEIVCVSAGLSEVQS